MTGIRSVLPLQGHQRLTPLLSTRKLPGPKMPAAAYRKMCQMGDAVVPVLEDDASAMSRRIGSFISLGIGGNSREAEEAKTRVLVSFEDRYRIYRDSIARAIRNARPNVEVMVCERRVLEAEVARFDPHLIICNPPIPMEVVAGRLAWVELSPYPEGTWMICIGGWCWESLNPSLSELLSVVDETEELATTKTKYES